MMMLKVYLSEPIFLIALLVLGVFGSVVVWAIIKLVNHWTGGC